MLRPSAPASLLSSPCSLFLLAAERPCTGQGPGRRGPGGALTAARGRAPHRAVACGRARCAGAREGGKRWQKEQKAGPGSSAGLTVLITGWEHTEADPSCQQPADLGRKGGEQGLGRAKPRFNLTPLQASGWRLRFLLPCSRVVALGVPGGRARSARARGPLGRFRCERGCRRCRSARPQLGGLHVGWSGAARLVKRSLL